MTAQADISASCNDRQLTCHVSSAGLPLLHQQSTNNQHHGRLIFTTRSYQIPASVPAQCPQVLHRLGAAPALAASPNFEPVNDHPNMISAPSSTDSFQCLALQPAIVASDPVSSTRLRLPPEDIRSQHLRRTQCPRIRRTAQINHSQPHPSSQQPTICRPVYRKYFDPSTIPSSRTQISLSLIRLHLQVPSLLQLPNRRTDLKPTIIPIIPHDVAHKPRIKSPPHFV
jgi:hypothetical protein